MYGIEYEWLSMEQHLVRTTRVTHVNCPACGMNGEPETDVAENVENHVCQSCPASVCGGVKSRNV